MMDHVEITLKRWRQSRFEYGRSDCILSLAEYASVDLRSQYAGSYSTEAEAEALIEQFGGIDQIIDLSGLPRIEPDQAKRGDIVVFWTGETAVGGICTGEGIAARTVRSTVEISRKFVEIIFAWEFGNVSGR